MRKLINRIQLSAIKFFEIQKFSNDEKIKYLIAFLVNIITLILSLSFALSFVGLSSLFYEYPFKNLFDDMEFRRFLIMSTSFITFSILTVIFFFFKYMQIWLWVYNLMLCVFILSLHYTSQGRAIEGTPITSLFITWFSGLVFGNYLNKIIWMIIPILIFFSCMVVDVFTFDVFWYCGLINNFSLYGTVTIFYAANYFPIFIGSIVLFFWNKRVVYTLKLIKELEEALFYLNFESDTIKKLLKKDDMLCNELELLFKRIVGNLIVYKKFLPIEFYDKNADDISNNVSETDSNISGCDSINKNVNLPTIHSKESKRVISSGLTEKITTLMMIKLNDIEDNIKLVERVNLHEKFKSFIEIVNKYVKSKKGFIDNIYQEYIVCSFDTVYKCMTPYINATEASLLIKQNIFKQLKSTVTIYIFNSPRFFYGNIISDESTSRRIVYGECINAILCHDKQFKIPNEIILDNAVKTKLKYHYEFKQIGITYYDSIKLFRLCKKTVSNKTDEWMYEIENSLKDTDTSNLLNYECAWKYLNEKKYIDALSSAEKYNKEHSEDNDTIYLIKNIKLLKMKQQIM